MNRNRDRKHTTAPNRPAKEVQHRAAACGLYFVVSRKNASQRRHKAHHKFKDCCRCTNVLLDISCWSARDVRQRCKNVLYQVHAAACGIAERRSSATEAGTTRAKAVSGAETSYLACATACGLTAHTTARLVLQERLLRSGDTRDTTCEKAVAVAETSGRDMHLTTFQGRITNTAFGRTSILITDTVPRLKGSKAAFPTFQGGTSQQGYQHNSTQGWISGDGDQVRTTPSPETLHFAVGNIHSMSYPNQMKSALALISRAGPPTFHHIPFTTSLPH